MSILSGLLSSTVQKKNTYSYRVGNISHVCLLHTYCPSKEKLKTCSKMHRLECFNPCTAGG